MFGIFEGSLTSANVPTIASGTVFDIKGRMHTVQSNYTITSFTPSNGGIIYVYASRSEDVVSYEFSTEKPAFNSLFKGFYNAGGNGNKRALWKMLHLPRTNRFLYKTRVDEDFPRFVVTSIDSPDYDVLTQGKAAYQDISASKTFNLPPGLYIVRTVGAGGGSSGSYKGGYGGIASEILTLDKETPFTAYAGTGGGNGETGASGTLKFDAYVNVFNGINPSSFSSDIFSSYEFKTTSNVLSPVLVKPSSAVTAGDGGGGGGAGAFLYSPDGNYFLVSGGGGGAAGATRFTPGGAGGTGGAIGQGGKGGKAGSFSQSGASSLSLTGGSAGTAGGNGYEMLTRNTDVSGGSAAGGHPVSRFTSASVDCYNAPEWGAVGTPSGSATGYALFKGGIDPAYPVVSLPSSYSASSSEAGGSAAAVSYITGHTQEWLNTKNANGKGGSAKAVGSASFSGSFTLTTIGRSFQQLWYNNGLYSSSLEFTFTQPNTGENGQDGGNNRNSSRGGGSAPGTAGKVIIYKLY